MRRLVAIGALALLAGAAPAAAPRVMAIPAGGATLVDDEVVDGTDGRVHVVTVASPALGRVGSVSVLLPVGYDDPANDDRTWPILWLLHGVGDDHTSWLNNADVEALTAGLPLVVAMPEAGKNTNAGWYSDWVSGPAWETFHLDELLPIVEERFDAGRSRQRRVVAGLSMGGFGAMSYAARHPDLWSATAAFSGAVHTTMADAGGALVFDTLQSFGTPREEVWGPYPANRVIWQGHDPVHLASNLRPLGDVRLRTGNGVVCQGDNPQSASFEAGVYLMNVAFHDRMAALGVAHDWFDRGCGTHEWHHWEADLAATLPAFMAVLAAPPEPPQQFDHRFVEDRRDVFGWTFEVTGRAGPAFTDLTGISVSGLTAAGAGTLSATTPPDHPGRWRVTTPAGASEVDGDDDERLRFELSLSATPATVTLEQLPEARSPAEPEATPAPTAAAPGGGSGLPATGGGAPLTPALVLLALGVLGLSRRHRTRTCI